MKRQHEYSEVEANKPEGVMIKCGKFVFEPENNEVVNFCYIIGSDDENELDENELDDEDCRVPEDKETENKKSDTKESENSESGTTQESAVSTEKEKSSTSVPVTPVTTVDILNIIEPTITTVEPLIERPSSPNPQTPDSPTRNLSNLVIGNPDRYVVNRSKFIDLLKTEERLKSREKMLKEYEENLKAREVELNVMGVTMQAGIECQARGEVEGYYLKSEEMRLAAENEYKQRVEMEQQADQLRMQLKMAVEMIEGVYGRMSEAGKNEMKMLVEAVKTEMQVAESCGNCGVQCNVADQQMMQGHGQQQVIMDQAQQQQMMHQAQYHQAQIFQQQHVQASIPQQPPTPQFSPMPIPIWTEEEQRAWHHWKDTLDERVHDRQMTEKLGPDWKAIVAEEKQREEWRRNMAEYNRQVEEQQRRAELETQKRMEEEKRIEAFKLFEARKRMEAQRQMEELERRNNYSRDVNMTAAAPSVYYDPRARMQDAVMSNSVSLDDPVERSLRQAEQVMKRESEKVKGADPFAVVKKKPEDPFAVVKKKGDDPFALLKSVANTVTFGVFGGNKESSNNNNAANETPNIWAAKGPANNKNTSNQTNASNPDPNNPNSDCSNSQFGFKRIDRRKL